MSRAVPIADDPNSWAVPDDIKARQQKPLLEQLAEAAKRVEWVISMGGEPVE